MSKIIGVTVGTTLPKPNFKQTDPTKGDYIKNKPDFEGLKSKVDTISDLVGDIKVSEQIHNSIDGSLSISGMAADAKTVGDALAEKQPVGNYALKSDIPVLDVYLTEETDPTVPAWAKAATKPIYIASEVGADASGTAASLINTHNVEANAHTDIREQISKLSYDIVDEIKTALTEAKASGEFDGKDGYTPVKGTDYYTDADKIQIVNDVLAALPTWTGGSY